jgi:hypothetical protein
MATVVGIFDKQSDASRAVNNLDALGLEPDSIRVLTRGRLEEQDSWLGALGRVFTAGDTPLEANLTQMGLTREEAEFYEQELGEDGILVAVETDEKTDHVMQVMRGANARLREA